MLVLERFCYSPMGTFGRLLINDHFFCYTVERPWQNNEENISCIPEGIYALNHRFSPTIKRTTGGEFIEGYEVTGVPYRNNILIHPGNTWHDFQGCIGVGSSLGYIGQDWAVLNSRVTFSKLMEKLDSRNDWEIKITHFKLGE